MLGVSLWRTGEGPARSSSFEWVGIEASRSPQTASVYVWQKKIGPGHVHVWKLYVQDEL